jgi:putative thiamine transport system ATP-binding protein
MIPPDLCPHPGGLWLDTISLWEQDTQTRLFTPLSLHIKAGEIVMLMGQSGVGKSSLLAFIAGLLSAGITGQGNIWLNGQKLNNKPAHLRRLGLLFQEDLLFPHLTVAENLAFALPHTLSKAEKQHRIAQALASADLKDFGKKAPHTLSGGQRARIAVMRALLADPLALLLDEPFSKLDMALRQSFRDFVFNSARLAQLPVLLVSHDPSDAPADGRIITLSSTP